MSYPSKYQPTSFRLTPEAVALLRILAKQSGLNTTRYLETLIRLDAERRGVAVPPNTFPAVARPTP